MAKMAVGVILHTGSSACLRTVAHNSLTLMRFHSLSCSGNSGEIEAMGILSFFIGVGVAMFIMYRVTPGARRAKR